MRMFGAGAATFRAAVVSLALVLAAVAPAQADNRVALVIGNAEYGPEIGRLKNPANDAKLIAGTLERLGFTVDLVLDADQKAMKRAVKSFGARLRAAGADAIGLFYYAGHGVQVGGENFLIPVGAEIAAEGDVELEAVSASGVLSQMQYAGNAINLVFLDACRNNPLTRSFRSGDRGLARVDAPRGSFVGYSTAPGEEAEDGPGANSPYALALATELQKPGEPVDVAHRNVRSKVLAATGKRQTPWDSSSLTGEVILATAATAAKEPPAESPSAQTKPGAASPQAELLFWESIRDSSNPAMFKAYLERYPDGEFVVLARAKIDELQPAQVAAKAPEAEALLPPTEAAPEVEELDASYVAMQTANVRAAPSTDAKVLAKLKEDDLVPVTGRVKGKDWLRVKVAEQSGYVSVRLLQAADADTVAAWKNLKGAPTPELVQAFLKAHPGGAFQSKAEALLASLRAAAETKSAPAVPAPETPVEPAAAGERSDQPKDPQQPAGTFVQEGSKEFTDGSGNISWRQTLVFNSDGTADITLSATEEFYRGWYLSGCAEGLRKGRYKLTRRNNVVMLDGGATVSLYLVGEPDVTDLSPSCWRFQPSLDNPYNMRWVNGQLSDADGEFRRAE